MKTIAKKEVETQKRFAVRYHNRPNYYFHPDEDFKEDYEWEKNRTMLTDNSKVSGQILR